MFFFSFFRSSFVHVHKLKCFFSLFSFICQKQKVSLTGWKMGTRSPVASFFSVGTWGSGLRASSVFIFCLILFLLIFVLRFFLMFSCRVSTPERKKDRKKEINVNVNLKFASKEQYKLVFIIIPFTIINDVMSSKLFKTICDKKIILSKSS